MRRSNGFSTARRSKSIITFYLNLRQGEVTMHTFRARSRMMMTTIFTLDLSGFLHHHYFGCRMQEREIVGHLAADTFVSCRLVDR